MENFLSYRRFFWFWLNLLLVLAMVVVYCLDHPVGGRNGGTIVGYTYGGIATAGILFLMWYAIRKRSYHASVTTLRGTLAAHVWIGAALSIIVPLHAGFSFGLNLHTLAYALMMIVIISGFWGAAYYIGLAPDIRSHRGEGTVKKLLEQVYLVPVELRNLTKDKSDQFLKLREKLDFSFKPNLQGALFGKLPKAPAPKDLAEFLSTLPAEEREAGLVLVKLIDKKRDLAERINAEAV
ncbi:MAG: hypothetical protein DCC75_13455, partial [Proteobacteria bacterium]